MADLKWTHDQEQAVKAPVGNILVTAAAGSGKTQVLTGRIVERILAGADITRLLVVTFTNAAAAEMRERIAKSLTEVLRADPENSHIRRQLLFLPSAKISTIHSFCLDVIRSNFFKAGLDAAFRVADETEAELLKLEAADEALEELYTEEEGSFIAFAEAFSGARGDSELIDILLQTYKFIESLPHPMKWLERCLCDYDLSSGAEFEKSKCAAELIAYAKKTLRAAYNILGSGADFCTPDNGLMPYKAMFAEDREAVSDVLSRADSWDGLRTALSNVIFKRRPNAKDADEAAKETAADLRKTAVDMVKGLSEVICYPAEESAALMRNMLPVLNGLILLVQRFTQIYSALKRKRGMLDFGDIEHICIELLECGGAPTDTALELRDAFDEIYIDEYQDSNDAQELIFNMISKGPNIFMVGDMKQSIYGFRQTSPRLFLEKKKAYKTGENEKYRKILLTKNFRSKKSVISCVNAVFSALMSEEMGGVCYDDEERLVCGAPYAEEGEKAELCIIDMSCEAESDEDLKSIEAEARLIRRKIQEAMRGRVFDLKKQEYRPMKYSDIAVLLRSAKSAAPIIEKELTDHCIPTFADSNSGYFELVEIKTFMQLLCVIDNPINDIALISLLRAPFIGFDEEDLASVRSFSKKGTYWEAVNACAALNTELGGRCREFLERLAHWRTLARYMPCDELIDYLFKDTGYINFVLSLPGGSMRAANLRLLFEKARSFEKTSFHGLFSFIRFIDRIKQSGSDTGSARLIGENHDVVRIMSIHKSKGLEFPVVILAGAGKRFNTESARGALLLHKDAGIGLDSIDAKRRIYSLTSVKSLVGIKIRGESVSEELRVLYVALTRAKERLIVTAAVRNLGKESALWQRGAQMLKSGDAPSVSSFLGWCGTCCALFAEDSPFEINIYTKGEEGVIPEAREQAADTAAESGGGDIGRILTYSYPHRDLWKIPSKVTVTELKRLVNSEGDSESFELFRRQEIREPAFLSGGARFSGAQIGSLIHFVMQTIPLTVSSLEDVRRHVARLTEQNIFTPEAASAVSCEKIWRFFASPVGIRLKNAQKVFREESFTMLAPASLITKNAADSAESILVQGIIDCFFIENGNIVLLDFKTDKVLDAEKLKKDYEVQLEIYAEALEKKYSSKINEKLIYLFDIDDIICYD